MFTNDEINLLCIYDTSTRAGLIAELMEMRQYLGAEEKDLRALTDSVLKKLQTMSDTEYGALELYPDYDNGGKENEAT